MTTNELTGRELAVACARAMNRSYFASTRHAMDWLHERGDLDIRWPSKRLADAAGQPEVCEARCWTDLRHIEMPAVAFGATFTEALQRLVVAVAQRGSKSKEAP